MSNHTPAPWKATTDAINYGDQIFIGTDTVLIAEMNDTTRNTRRAPHDVCADARLIAAAPELLEMLTMLCNYAAPTKPDSTGQEMVKLRQAAIDKARAVIAKAKSE